MMTIARFLAKIAELVKSELTRPKHDVRQGIIHKSIGKVVSQYLILFPAIACLSRHIALYHREDRPAYRGENHV